jgi:hypothetical protein
VTVLPFGGVMHGNSPTVDSGSSSRWQWQLLEVTHPIAPRDNLYLIWREPWMSAAPDTYISQTLALVNWRTLPDLARRSLADAAARDWAVRDYKRQRWKPASVNLALAVDDRVRGTQRADLVELDVLCAPDLWDLTHRLPRVDAEAVRPTSCSARPRSQTSSVMLGTRQTIRAGMPYMLRRTIHDPAGPAHQADGG